MENLKIVIIGLALIEFLFVVLSTTRISIKKGQNSVLWFILSVVFNFFALAAIYFIEGNSKKEKTEFDKTIIDITQPFIDLLHTSVALSGVNVSYILEGITYFGVLGLLAIFFNDFIGLNDIDAGLMVAIQTGGITLSMLFLGATVDWIGVRKAFLFSLAFMLVGRIILTISPDIGIKGYGEMPHIFAMLGILGIILGYGIYQPAAYAAVKQFTNKNTAGMGYAMLYGLMNLGGFLPGLISPPVRNAYGIQGVFWVYVGLTVAGIFAVYFMITKKAVQKALQENRLEDDNSDTKDDDELLDMKLKDKIKYYIKNFPLRDARFLFFIFALIPVQTLFAHNWLTIPQYTSRAFEGFVEENFEFFVNLNPIFIFILTPIVTALTLKKDTYNMMIIGTFVMAAPTFILTLGPNIYTLLIYIGIMTIGEAMWQPRFLQWVAEIAPKNMTGIYMGIGQFPWFLTKIITGLYSGWFLTQYCPTNTPPSEMNTEFMWLIYGIIAISSPVALLLAKGWMQKGFKTKHGE